MFFFNCDLPDFCSNSIVTLKDGSILYCENEVLEIEEQKQGNQEVVLILSDKKGEKISVCSCDITNIEYSD